MELSAFGAIMKFAMEREEEIAAVMKRIGSVGGESFRKLGERIAADAAKSIKFLERTRREHVNELILEEPTTGLFVDDYLCERPPREQPTPAEAGRYLIDMLDVIIRFYTDAAAKATNPEAARTFNRIAKKKAKLKASLEEYISGLE
jgi:hypothetical protein